MFIHISFMYILIYITFIHYVLYISYILYISHHAEILYIFSSKLLHLEVLAMFDAALLATLAVALVAEGEKTSRMLLQHGEEVEPWRRK